jgi:2,4-dienoyl-CoA reductase-like NADH-dependent reductase (Old Yellow Enzyme family)
VEARGRITISDLGIWKDEHIPGLQRITDFIRAEGAVAGIQLGHAGRKASYAPPFGKQGMRPLRQLSSDEGAWQVLGASAVPFSEDSAMPIEMTHADIAEVVESFARAAARAESAGFDWIEVHAAHGYLPHCFCSPVSNKRTDEFGGSFENRVRLSRQIARAIRTVWPDSKVLTFRLSHTDWLDGGWTTEEAVELSRLLRADGVDLIVVSSGGSSASTVALARQLSHDKVGTSGAREADNKMSATIPIGPGYQVPGAEAVKTGANIPVAAVGLITRAEQADQIIRNGQADMVMLARELLRDPYWPHRAAIALGETNCDRIPAQYYLAWKDYGDFCFLPGFAPTID